MVEKSCISNSIIPPPHLLVGILLQWRAFLWPSFVNYSCLHWYPMSSWTYILFTGYINPLPSRFSLMLQFAQIWSVEQWKPRKSCSCILLGVPLFFFENFFWYSKVFLALLVLSLFRPWNQPFPKELWFLLCRMVFRIKSVLLTIVLLLAVWIYTPLHFP